MLTNKKTKILTNGATNGLCLLILFTKVRQEPRIVVHQLKPKTPQRLTNLHQIMFPAKILKTMIVEIMYVVRASLAVTLACVLLSLKTTSPEVKLDAR